MWETVSQALQLFLIWIIVLFLLNWMYCHFTRGVCRSEARMDGKTVIVTGSNSGIGKETACNLAARGARVIMACRDLHKANQVREQIIEATNNSNVVVKKLDLSSFKAIREFAEDMNKSERRLDVLIHNAANIVTGSPTEDGVNPVWATNVYGPFLLTDLLIELMKRTGKARIVWVSSVLHWLGKIDPENPNPVHETNQSKLYYDTKFAILLLSNELSRRLSGTGVTSNALHPGVILTPIWEKANYYRSFVWLWRPFVKSEKQGAETTVYAAVSEELEGVSGKYFQDCHERFSRKKTRDKDLAMRFWKASEEMVKLSESDPRITYEEKR